MSQDRFVVIGKVGKPFGVKGEVRIRPYTNSLEIFQRSAVLVLDTIPYTVLSLRGHKGSVIVSLEGINTPEAAKKLVGQLVKTDESNLPPKEEDEYYWHELIGLRVFTQEGRDLGVITSIIETGAHDVLQIEGSLGEVLLPMIDEVVIQVDSNKGEMVVDPLDGLIPET